MAMRETAAVPQATDDRAGWLEQALLIRAVEQRLLDLYGEGHLHGTVHTCIGQELTGIAVARALRPGDWVISNHRGHGHYLAWTDDIEGLIAEVMGRATGLCGGRGGSQHLAGDGFLSNGIVGGMTPVAAGLALAGRLDGDDRVVALFIGDGSLSQGVVTEGLNLAAVLGLPLYVLCEVNGVAQSTDTAQVQAGEAEARAAALGIATARSDTWHPDTLMADVGRAVDTVRRNGQPFFHRVDTFRLAPHSKGDDSRPADVVEAYRKRDPVVLALAEGADESAPRDRVERAVAVALKAPPAKPLPDASGLRWAETEWRPARPPEGRCIDHIRDGLTAAMANDPRAMLLGEDVLSPYGGAFKATAGLSDRFPDRVLTMPISEAAIVGTATGLAVAGRRPIAEIMFGDFLALGFDQLLNHAAKFRAMSNDRLRVPMILRTPMGGRRGYGPTHSQTLDKHFLGIPGLTVAALHHRADAAELYPALLATIEDPHLIIENKTAYGRDATGAMLDGFAYLESDEPLPTLWVRPEGPAALTILCYGGMLAEVEAALDHLFVEHDIIAEAFCPIALHPLNLLPVATAVAATQHLLIVEEGPGFCGFGSEVGAALQERLGGRFRLRRLAAQGAVVPAAPSAEDHALPNTEAILSAALGLLA